MKGKLTIAAQLSSVHSSDDDLQPETVLKHLQAVQAQVSIDILVVGWEERPDLFTSLTDSKTRPVNEIFLWYPFLSDYPGMQSSHLVVDYLSGKSAGWDGYAGTGINETFKQSCPNNPQTLATSLQHMKRILSTYAFDGVFIDKIRFPSMANGLTEVFSCFCEHCMAKAAKIGLDLNEVRSVLALNGGEKQAGLGVDLPPGSKWLEVLVKNQGLLQQFIRFRADSINQVVHQISMEVRGLGKKLSLDVFSPGLTALVGQDLTFLGQTADWVKPMIYRFGNGPSSLRSEIPAMINSFGKFLGLEKAEVMKWVWENVDGLRGIPLEEIDKVAPLSLLKAEAHKAVQLLPETAVYLGLETVSIPGVMTITPQNVAEILEIGDKAGVDGYVLSWDLLHTPIENILPLKALA